MKNLGGHQPLDVRRGMSFAYTSGRGCLKYQKLPPSQQQKRKINSFLFASVAAFSPISHPVRLILNRICCRWVIVADTSRGGVRSIFASRRNTKHIRLEANMSGVLWDPVRGPMGSCLLHDKEAPSTLKELLDLVTHVSSGQTRFVPANEEHEHVITDSGEVGGVLGVLLL